tara:strand:+ start:159 stop:428 length:270 start_codon:yes stop_codon:yes gene_type:complete
MKLNMNTAKHISDLLKTIRTNEIHYTETEKKDKTRKSNYVQYTLKQLRGTKVKGDPLDPYMLVYKANRAKQIIKVLQYNVEKSRLDILA